MATAPSSYIPVELYLRSEYEPDAEYVDGVIEERAVGELDHVLWQKALIRWFLQHESTLRIRVLFELRVQVTPTRFRVPDVVVIESSGPKEQILTKAPLAVFEILSPEDDIKRVLRKLVDYASMGIAQIWVIDPETNQSYRFVEGKLIHATQFGEPGDRIHFAMSEVEALLD
jgi:Uma2 family endonuclease